MIIFFREFAVLTPSHVITKGEIVTKPLTVQVFYHDFRRKIH